MKGILITMLLFMVIAWMLPFLLKFSALIFVVIAIYALLRQIGLVGGGRTYRRPDSDSYESRDTSHAPPRTEPNDPGRWGGGYQQGDVITLPDDALKKDDGE